jgi:hypothetical protein
MRANWADVPFIYRVELQKRKTPHLHLVAYIDAENVDHYMLWRQWLECTGEQFDLASQRHAVKVKPMTDAHWLLYVASHDSKHKAEQLGWVGKQWGVVGRSRFERRVSEDYALTWPQRAKFQRLLRRLLKSRGVRHTWLSARGTWLRVVDGETSRLILRWVLAQGAAAR